MTVLAVHLPPAVTIATAALVVAWVVWYWQRTGQTDVPPSRRVIRRLSLVVVTGSLPVYIAALSYSSADDDAAAYVRIWSAAIALLALLVILACIDVINNLRLHRIERAMHQADSVRKIADTIRKAQREHAPSGDPPGGSSGGSSEGSSGGSTGNGAHESQRCDDE